MVVYRQYIRNRAGTQRGGSYKIMKISKREFAILMLGVLFLAVTAGWFLRDMTFTGPVRVEAEGWTPELSMTVDLTGEPPEPPAQSGPEKAVNINTAGAEELMTLPGIGEKRAKDIIAEREENGPFRFPEDITRVNGIGEDTMNKLIDYIITEEGP